MDNLKNIVRTDAAFEILDNSNCAGSDWGQGGCAILASALNKLEGYPIYVIYNKEYRGAEHFGAMTPSGSIIDHDGEHPNKDAWLNFFKNNEMPRPGELVVIPYSSEVGMEGIKFDDAAAEELAKLIKSRQMIRETVKDILNESEGKTWYHGTPDVRELEKEGGFSERYLNIEYVDDIEGYEKVQSELGAAREGGNEDEYFRILDTVGGFIKNVKIRKPIFLTDTYSIARTYADPQRAFDYQSSVEKVLSVHMKDGKGVTINATGDRFRFIDINKVRRGFLNAGVDESELDLVIRKLNYAVGVDKGIKTDNIAAIGDWFKFDYIDVIGVLDSYQGGKIKSTVRMVFNPSDISIIKNEGKSMFEVRKLIRKVLKESLIGETIEGNYNAYHGSETEINKFTDDFVGGKDAADQQGAGIYFTTNEKDARYYGDYIYSVFISGNFLDKDTPSEIVDVEKLVGLIKNGR